MKKYYIIIVLYFSMTFGEFCGTFFYKNKEGAKWNFGVACLAQEKTCQQLLDDARQSYNTREFDACIKNCNTIISSCKEFDFNQTHLYLISSYLEKNEKDSAAIFLKRAVKQKPFFIYYKETETDEFQLLCKQYELQRKLSFGIFWGINAPWQKIKNYNSILPFQSETNSTWHRNNVLMLGANACIGELYGIIEPEIRFNYFQQNLNRNMVVDLNSLYNSNTIKNDKHIISEEEKQNILMTTAFFNITGSFSNIKRDAYLIEDFQVGFAWGISNIYCKSKITRNYKPFTTSNTSANEIVENFDLELAKKNTWAFPIKLNMSKRVNNMYISLDIIYANLRNIGAVKSNENLNVLYNNYYAQNDRRLKTFQFQLGLNYHIYKLVKK